MDKTILPFLINLRRKVIKKDSINLTTVVIIICSLLAVFISVYLVVKANNDKIEQAKKDALVITSSALREYIESEGYNSEDNVAIVYSLSELDKLENVLSCPFNKKEYTKGSSVVIHYDQNNKELSLSTKLQCGNRVINYHCDIKNDILNSNCEFDIYKK